MRNPQRPLSGLKRTWRGLVCMSANDPRRTYAFLGSAGCTRSRTLVESDLWSELAYPGLCRLARFPATAYGPTNAISCAIFAEPRRTPDVERRLSRRTARNDRDSCNISRDARASHVTAGGVGSQLAS